MSAAGLTIRRATVTDDPAWDALVLGAAEGTAFHRPHWLRAACSRFGHQDRTLVAQDAAGSLVGVLPLVEFRGLGSGRAWISVPYAVYGGAVATTAEAVEALHQTAARVAQQERIGRLELRCRRDPGLDWEAGVLHEGFSRDLPADPAAVLGSMPKKARADARRARRDLGLELEEGRWYLPDLVRLFQRNKQALGTPALPYGWFEDLALADLDRTHLHVVRRGHEVLAAVLSFSYQGELHAYYSGTAEGADRSYKASSFLYCALQEWAIERGFTRFDFGRSRIGSGAHDFKRRQGFEPEPLGYRTLLVRDRSLPSLNPSNPRTAWAQRVWRGLPRDLAVPLGGYLSRFLP
ncbi:MAG: GNAT family N-acetyltransferase [Planctomycetes bacterium]|nr:GNAT family N-acetyltransferase [Planctomycetota bacterium]